MGIRAAEVALDEIGPPAEDEEVVAVVETDMCGVDAIQFLLGCTFGKGNLIHRDYGKNAYTVFRRSDGKAVRISERPGTRRPPEPEPESEDEFFERQRQRVERILTAPIDELYQVRPVTRRLRARPASSPRSTAPPAARPPWRPVSGASTVKSCALRVSRTVWHGRSIAGMTKGPERPDRAGDTGPERPDRAGGAGPVAVVTGGGRGIDGPRRWPWGPPGTGCA